MFNVKLYPFLTSASLKTIFTHPAVQNARKKYLKTGMATFQNFLTKEAITEAVSESKNETGETIECFVTDTMHNVYLLPQDPSFSNSHIRNKLLNTKVASIAGDELPKSGVLLSVYQDPRVIALVQAVTGVENLHLSDDPLGKCSINVFKKGWAHGFHFDESEFSTTIMLQKPEAGGVFQYTDRLRKSDSQMVYEQVEKVVENEEGLSDLVFEPGTLSVFSGRYSQHRVTDVVGEIDRLVAVLTYAQKEGYRNSPEVQRMFWGRSAQ